MPLALLESLVRRARAVVTLATLSVCSIVPVGDLGNDIRLLTTVYRVRLRDTVKVRVSA